MIVYKAHTIQPLDSGPPPDPPLSSDASIASASATPADRYLQSSQSDQQRQSLPTEFIPSDEMAPAWWPIDQLPWELMRINHMVWYPFLLAGRPFAGVYWYETRSSFPGEDVLDDKQPTKKQPLRKENAQRENSKEIWVEDLEKRCFQFGRQRIDTTLHPIQDQLEGSQRLLADFASRLGLVDACYREDVAVALQDRKGHRSTHGLGPAPVPNDSIDEVWLDGVIAKAEKDWMLRPSVKT
ncbi:unnamed protein product [Mortierella alpina]